MLGARTWEHLLDHLHRTKPSFHMNAEVLETRPVSEILLNIVLEWSKVGGKVTVREFCDVSKEMGIGRVEHVLCEAECAYYSNIGMEHVNSSPVFLNYSPQDSDEAHV